MLIVTNPLNEGCDPHYGNEIPCESKIMATLSLLSM